MLPWNDSKGIKRQKSIRDKNIELEVENRQQWILEHGEQVEEQ